MIKVKQKNIYIAIGLGLLLQIAGVFVQSPIGMDAALSAILIISGLSLFVWGCWSYAQKKGYSGAWGLLGFLNLLGLLVLFLFKDKSKQKLVNKQ